MITISLCMIVKNEAAILERCLNSLVDLMDEIIIVDTGSTDGTPEIAARYTDKVYHFEWTEDFSAARNFSFSKASMEYIYAPDADEVLDETNRERFRILKQALLPEIEIVQMKYVTRDSFDSVLNSHKEYRPKLFKRLRTFVWIDPVHETVRLDPVVYDSEIEILHLPQSLHHKRNFNLFLRAFRRNHILSDSNVKMYARELLKRGAKKDFIDAEPVFTPFLERPAGSDLWTAAICVLIRKARFCNEINSFFTSALKGMLTQPCSEICYDLGMHYLSHQEYSEAILWFCNAAYESHAELDIHTGGDLPLHGLITCFRELILANPSSPDAELWRQALEQYHQELAEWKLPEEL